MAGRFTARRSRGARAAAGRSACRAARRAPGRSCRRRPCRSAGDRARAASSNPLLSDKLLDAKVRLHRRLIEEINLSALEKLPEDGDARARPAARRPVCARRAARAQYAGAQRIRQRNPRRDDRPRPARAAAQGPDHQRHPDQRPRMRLCRARRHAASRCRCRFKDEAHLLRIINKIVSAVGRRVDESHPMCDARLLDGSRVNAAMRPIGVDGPLVSIRKFSKKPFNLQQAGRDRRAHARRWRKCWPPR